MNIVPSKEFLPAHSPSETSGAPAYPSEPGAKIFFIDVLSTIHRHGRLAALVGASVAALVVVIVLTLTPLYKSTASIMLDTRREKVVDLEAVLSNLPSDTFVVDSEVEVLRSPALAQQVISRLRLDRDPEFNAQLRPASFFGTAWSQVKSGIRQGLIALGLTTAGDVSAAQRRQQSVVEAFENNLAVERTGLTYVITVAFWSEDPAKAVRITNAIADAYLAQQLTMKVRATQQANTQLEKRVAALRTEVRDAEQAVADYKAQHGLLNAVGAPLAEQEITALSTQLATARAEEAEQQGKLNAANQQMGKGGLNGVGQAAVSDTVRELRRQQAEVQRQVADLKVRYGAKHPDLIKARQELSAINSAIGAEVHRVVGSLQAEASAAHERTASLEASINSNRDILAKNNSAGVRLGELERNATAVRTLYESFLNRFKETAAQQGLQDTDAQIVSRGSIPLKPSYPSWMMTAAAAVLLALLAAASAIGIREMTDRGIKSPEDAEAKFGLPVLATLPLIAKGNPAAYAVKKPMSGFAEAFRNLRTSLFLSRSSTPPKVVAITSAIPGEGKTTSALALGRSAAMAGAKVLIVDGDLRRRSLTMRIPYDVQHGLGELVAGTATLDQCLCKDQLTDAMILPVADSSFASKDVYLEHELERIFDLLRARFDIIIIDTAPLLPLAEPRIIASHADAAILLARWNRTSRSAISEAIRLLRSIDVPIAGLALSCVDLKLLGSFGYSARTYGYRSQYAAYYIE